MDGGGKYGITNWNSIGIEICVNPDSDYNKTVAHTIELTKYLMDKFNIPADRVVRHYDASRKWCPGSMGNDGWAKWYDFKSKLAAPPEPPKPHWAKSAHDELVKLGILKSDHTEMLDKPATEGVIIQIAYNVIKYLKG